MTKGLDRKSFERFKLVLLGHIHQPQHLGGNAYYTGTSIPQGFTEADQHGVYCVFDDTDGEVTWLKNSAPRFLVWDGKTDMDLSNSYVKVLAEPSEALEAELRSRGALASTFSPPPRKTYVPVRTTSVTLADSLPTSVKKFAESKSAGLDTAALTDIGLNLLRGGD